MLDLDRRASDCMLALLVQSDEADLVINAGISADTRSFTAFDVVIETYKWWKVFRNVDTTKGMLVLFNLDGT